MECFQSSPRAFSITITYSLRAYYSLLLKNTVPGKAMILLIMTLYTSTAWRIKVFVLMNFLLYIE